MIRKRLLIICALCLFFIVSPAVLAEDKNITISPSSISLAGDWGSAINSELFLYCNNTIQDISLIPLGIVNSPGTSFLSQSDLIQNKVQPDGNPPLVVEVPFSLSTQNLSSGAYTGSLILQYYDTNIKKSISQPVPIKIFIKDPVLRPLIILILSVLIGVGIFQVYKKYYWPFEKVKKEYHKIKMDIDVDTDLKEQIILDNTQQLVDNPFLVELNEEKKLFKEDIRYRNLTKSKLVLQTIQFEYLKWCEDKLNWGNSFKRFPELFSKKENIKSKINESDPGFNKKHKIKLTKSIDKKLDTDWLNHNIKNYPTPDELNTQIDTITDEFTIISGIIDDLIDIIITLPKPYQNRSIDKWINTVANPKLTAGELYKLREEIYNDNKEILTKRSHLYLCSIDVTIKPAQRKGKFSLISALKSLKDKIKQLFDYVIKIVNPGPEKPSPLAYIFNPLSVFLLFFVLLVFGWGTLYMNNSTFGSNLALDYGGLILWGIGANAVPKLIFEALLPSIDID